MTHKDQPRHVQCSGSYKFLNVHFCDVLHACTRAQCMPYTDSCAARTAARPRLTSRICMQVMRARTHLTVLHARRSITDPSLHCTAVDPARQATHGRRAVRTGTTKWRQISFSAGVVVFFFPTSPRRLCLAWSDQLSA